MNGDRPGSKPLALVPLDGASSGDDSARPTAADSSAVEPRQPRVPKAASDEFLVQAAKEYQEGRFDPDLWQRTSTQFDGNRSLAVPAYLRLRARELRRRTRDDRAGERARSADSMHGTSRAGHDRFKPYIKYAVAGVALAATVVVWLVASPRDSEPVPQSIAAAAPASRKPASPPKSRAGDQAVVTNPIRSANQDDAATALETKVQELEKAGNWNVLVLYASEWTRKEPNNATAWTQLSIGYAQLRQLADALDAATKAVQLAPEDSRHWRNLGHVTLALDRFPEARIAFDKVLAVSADDADALCGAAAVAKGEGRVKDADGIAARLKAIGGRCDGASDAVSSPIVAGGAAARKAVSRK